jgi:hypothetical protein
MCIRASTQTFHPQDVYGCAVATVPSFKGNLLLCTSLLYTDSHSALQNLHGHRADPPVVFGILKTSITITKKSAVFCSFLTTDEAADVAFREWVLLGH